MIRYLIPVLFWAGAGCAECPASPDISTELDGLIEQARAASNDMEGRDISGKMWELYLAAPDAAAQEALDKGMRARSSFDFLGAVAAFDTLIAYCPDYAEGFNQRAYTYFLSENYEAALADLDRTLDLSPKHLGALSGRALTLLGLGRLAEARVQLLEALEVNPWLSERFLMSEGGPLAIQGKDI